LKLYSNGKPFTGYITRDLVEARRRIDNNLPCAFLVVAPPGKGKTTLATHIAEEYMGKPLIFEDQLGNGFLDFNKKLKICRIKDFDLVIYDEGGDIDKRKWMSDTNYKIKRILQLYRGFKMLLIICIQDYSSLDDTILNTEVIQGLFQIPQRRETYADYKMYSLERMYWLLKWVQWLKKNKQSPNKAFMKVPANYHGTFYNLSPARALELENYSLKAKGELLDDLTGTEAGLFDYAAIGSATGYTMQTAKKNVQLLGLHSLATKIKGKNWFNDAAFKEICDKLGEPD